MNQHGQGNNEENDQAENCGIRVTWSGYVVVARGTRRRPPDLSQGRPSPPKPQSKCTEEAHRTQSAPDANYQDRRGGGLARGTWNRPSAHAKIGPRPPRGDNEMQKKRTGPGAPRAGRSEGKSGETRRLGEGLGKLGICRRLIRRK